MLQLDQPSLGLRREFLIKGVKDKLVKAYYDYMVDIAVLFGAERERATKELMESLDFEIKLANVLQKKTSFFKFLKQVRVFFRFLCPARRGATPPPCTTR